MTQHLEVGNNCLIRKEWENFIKYDQIPTSVNSAVVASWQRCKKWNLDPYYGRSSKILEHIELQTKLKENNIFIKTAIPYMEKVYQSIKGFDCIVCLIDEAGWILQVMGDKHVEELFSRNLNFQVGASWDEKTVGTTAVSVALAEEQPVPFMAEEKYCHDLKEWGCLAAPIKDKTGGIKGLLGVAGKAQILINISERVFYLMLAAVIAIENRLQVVYLEESFYALTNIYKSVLNSVSDALISVDSNGTIKQINNSAANLLALEPSSVIGVPAQEILKVDPIKAIKFSEDEPISSIITQVNKEQLFWEFSPVMGVDGKLDGVIGIITNKITPKAKKHKKRMVTFDDIIGESKEIREIKKLLQIAAREDSSILILGDTGTGKELFVQAIYNYSSRADGPLIAVNCGALPENLIESEFFGYEEGAFTGARKGGQMGKFELANGGILFLDEIGEMSLNLQVRLLRAIEEKTITRIGGSRSIPVDVRIIAATNKNLWKEVQEGNFRSDLYWRLNVITVELPPLVQRREDIPLLSEHFLKKYSRKRGRVYTISEDGMKVLMNHDWPGNVRELKNVIERCAIFAEDGIINSEHILKCIMPYQSNKKKANKKVVTIEDAERTTIYQALLESKGNITCAARMLGIARNTLYQKIKKYGIELS